MWNPPPSRTFRLERGRCNPQGARDTEVFVLKGNVTAGAVHHLEFAEDVSLPPRRHFSSDNPTRLKILHFNDLHGQICRFTDHGEIPVFSKIVNRINTLRAQLQPRPDAAMLVMSAGDDLVGSVFDELLGEDPTSFHLHAGYRLYSAAGIDIAVLGNHDFDMGPALLAEAIRHDAQFPVLSANLIGSSRLEEWVSPAALIVIKGIRVGVIGLSTPGEIGEQWLDEFRLINPVPVVHNILPVLRPLCDICIILSHLGYSLQSSKAMVRYAGDVELARSLLPHSVHLIVGGHTHSILNEQGLSPDNIVNGIPIVQAGTNGEFLGETDITLRGMPAVSHVRLTRTAILATDEIFERQEVEPLKKLVEPIVAKPLGRTANSPDLSPESVDNDIAVAEFALANFIADALVARCHSHGLTADLAFIDASCLHSGIPVDDVVTFGQWFNVMPYADTIRLCWLSGQQLLELLQDNAYRVDRPGEPHVERGFLHFSRQLRYTIRLQASRQEAQVVASTFNGQALEQLVERTFLAACTSFVREPAAAWEKLAKHNHQLSLFDLHSLSHIDTGLFLRREIIHYIREKGGVTAEAGARRDGRLQLIVPEFLCK